MPQLILEYSENIIEKDNLKKLLKEINLFLTQTLPAQLSACKARAIQHDVYCMADGSPTYAFVHVSLKVIAGRTQDKLNEAGKGLTDILRQYFHQSLKQLNLEISIEIRELQQTYFKFHSDTFH